MASSGISRVTSIEDVTKEWLTSILAFPIEIFTHNRIGTGQVSWTYRVNLIPSSPSALSSVILKVASSNPESRSAGLSLGIYEKEVCFYQSIAPSLSTIGSLAICYHASFDPVNGTFALLLRDAEAEIGNDITGASIEQARIAVTELGRIHGEVLRNEKILNAGWLSRRKSRLNQGLMKALFTGFVERYEGRLKKEHMNVCRSFVQSFDAFQERQEESHERKGLVHGDYRLDNLLFGKEGDLTVVDWQTVFVGPVMTDFAYFVGGSLRVQDRREHLKELLKLYMEALGDETGMSMDSAMKGLREQTFFGILMCIASPMLVERTERGDEMFMVMMERHCTFVTDVQALELLPKSEVQVPLQPAVEDEHPHSPGQAEFWNESWYFDLVDEKSGVGLYVRLGHYPNLKGSWYTTVITHPVRGLLAVSDYECPHPKSDLIVKTDRFEAAQQVISPLKDYRVTLKGTAEQFDDPADVLRGKSGKDAQVEMDISWKTDDTPYQWRMTTRYEIPCRATGSVVINGEKIQFKDVVAQRDHSHGVRDWWGADWMWCAFHLHDGTRIHGADLRIPQLGRLSVGYIQGPNMPITELSKCQSDEKMRQDGLPLSAKVLLEYRDESSLMVGIEPVGHGPLRLVAPDGRVSNFTRCWAQLKCSDGRTGVGWIEWNHNVRKP